MLIEPASGQKKKVIDEMSRVLAELSDCSDKLLRSVQIMKPEEKHTICVYCKFVDSLLRLNVGL